MRTSTLTGKPIRPSDYPPGMRPKKQRMKKPIRKSRRPNRMVSNVKHAWHRFIANTKTLLMGVGLFAILYFVLR